MKRQIIKKSVEFFMFVGLILAAFSIVPVNAQETLGGGYEFGPGTANASEDSVFLRVPARTNVGIVVALQRNLFPREGFIPPPEVNVRIEVFAPGGTTPLLSQTASATVVNGLMQVPTIAFPGVYTSQLGCPDRWRVRIRGSNGAPPVRVFGTVTFAFVRPGRVNLAMENGMFDLNGGGSATRTLTGHDLTQLNRNLIAGTGQFRVRARWHTDPFSGNFDYHRMTVQLIRPDNSPAPNASEFGFSQHAPADRNPKVDFTYNVSPEDARMSGTWKVRVTSPGGTPKIVDFDIEKGAVDVRAPGVAGFHSTFQAQCSNGVAVN